MSLTGLTARATQRVDFCCQIRTVYRAANISLHRFLCSLIYTRPNLSFRSQEGRNVCGTLFFLLHWPLRNNRKTSSYWVCTDCQSFYSHPLCRVTEKIHPSGPVNLNFKLQAGPPVGDKCPECEGVLHVRRAQVESAERC